jgi:hypothetical protein
VGFNPSDYQDVDTRVHLFYQAHPRGRIISELVAYSDREFIVRAEVYRDQDDSEPAATGLAQEIVGSTPVNKTSALENCETSAIGRALANLGLSPKGQRPSVEEMQKAERAAKQHAADLDEARKGMKSADSLEMLDDVARKAKRIPMSDAERSALRRIYLDRKAELTPAAEEVPA